MRKRTRIFIVVFVLVLFFATAASSRQSEPKGEGLRQVVVLVHRAKVGLVFEMKSSKVKKGDANYWLAEIKLQECKDCRVIPIIDDDVPLEAITQISEMAINAGFTDIRPFVHWKKTGNMAEIQFGPPIRFTADTQKIEKRIAKAR